jgi:hypothetical protein
MKCHHYSASALGSKENYIWFLVWLTITSFSLSKTALKRTKLFKMLRSWGEDMARTPYHIFVKHVTDISRSFSSQLMPFCRAINLTYYQVRRITSASEYGIFHVNIWDFWICSVSNVAPFMGLFRAGNSHPLEWVNQLTAHAIRFRVYVFRRFWQSDEWISRSIKR